MKRPKLVLVSDEMRHISALLEEELLRWPQVTVRPMFGMRAFYRKGVVFALLPAKRAMDVPNAVAYKLPTGKEKREGEKWKLFEVPALEQISAALAVLFEAYEKTTPAPVRK